MSEKRDDKGRYMKGHHNSPEIIKKISDANSGENHYLYGKHLSSEIRTKISEANKGKTIPDEVKRKISNTLKEMKLKTIFKKGHKVWLGKKHTEESKKKMSNAKKGKKFPEEHKKKISESLKGNKNNLGHKLTEEHKKKISKWNKGKIISKETREKLSIAQRGERGSNWQGGKSFEIYGMDFNNELKKQVRKRDNYTCQECDFKENGRKMDVHHIDYNKKNNNPDNLILLCGSCHAKTNPNRENWEKYYKEKVKINAS